MLRVPLLTAEALGDWPISTPSVPTVMRWDALFVRDGIHSVADYNSTWMGVVVLVLILVLVVVILFHDGITRERFELSS